MAGLFDSIKTLFSKRPAPPPDISALVRVCGQAVVEEFFSPDKQHRVSILRDDRGIFRVRSFRWCTEDWEVAGRAFWIDVSAMNTMTDTLENARRLARERLSSIRYAYFISSLPSLSYFKILTVKFEGDCGYGSGSNADAAFMCAVIAAGLQAWQPAAVILDLRQLGYEWGDELVKLFDMHPSATVALVGEGNRAGLTSLVRDEMFSRPDDYLFETFDDAVRGIQKRVTSTYGAR